MVEFYKLKKIIEFYNKHLDGYGEYSDAEKLLLCLSDDDIDNSPEMRKKRRELELRSLTCTKVSPEPELGVLEWGLRFSYARLKFIKKHLSEMAFHDGEEGREEIRKAVTEGIEAMAAEYKDKFGKDIEDYGKD